MWQRVLNMLVLSGLANFRSEDYELTGITVPRQLPQIKDQIFGCCPQVLQGKHSASVTGSKRPGGASGVNKMSPCKDLSENRLMCRSPLRSRKSSTRMWTSQTVCGTRKVSISLRQMWLTGSLPGWLERMATCQQMRWKCWGGNIRTVRFFIALETIDKVTPTPHAKQQTHAAKIDTSRQTAEQIYCHICMFKTTLKGFIIIKVAIFQLMYYPVSRFLTFPRYFANSLFFEK